MNTKELDALKKEHVFNGQYIHKKIYIDLQFFKDIFLGVIFNNIKTEEQYNNLLIDINKNKDRIIENSTILFPSIRFGKIAYEDYISNINNHNNIFKVAPITSFLDMFITYINKVIKINKMTIENESYIPTIYINTNILSNLGKIYKEKLKEFLLTKFYAKIEFINKDILSIQQDIFIYDSLFIYEFKSFIENPYYKKAFEEVMFINKVIVSPKMLYKNTNLIGLEADPIKLKSNTVLLKEFEIIEAYLNIITDFNFIPPFTLNPL